MRQSKVVNIDRVEEEVEEEEEEEEEEEKEDQRYIPEVILWGTRVHIRGCISAKQ